LEICWTSCGKPLKGSILEGDAGLPGSDRELQKQFITLRARDADSILAKQIGIAAPGRAFGRSARSPVVIGAIPGL
jgi:hypothetical protein